MNIDIDGSTNQVPSGPLSFPGIKLPNDGKISFFQLEKFQLSKQEAMEWIAGARDRIRPWTTFFATTRYKAPVAAQRLPRRIVMNLEYFQSNYLFVFVGLFFFCLITSPFLLLVMLLLFSASYWVMANDRLAVVFGHKLSAAQKYSLMGLCSMPILYLSGATAALFWVFGASSFLILTHAIFYDIQSLLDPAEDGFELNMEQVV